MRARRSRAGTIVLVAAALVLMAGVIGWIGSRGDGGSGGADESSSIHRSSTGQARNAGALSSAGGSSDSQASTTTAPGAASGGAGTGPAVTPKVVKTGSLDLTVKAKTFTDAEARLRSIAEGAGGYVAGSSTSSSRGVPSGSLTLRVPADRFDAIVGQVGRLGEVTASESRSQDVTGEYTDLQSRLRAATAEREQILLVLGEARDVPQILQVRDRLDDLQAQIEEMQGRLKVLDDQTSLSTLTVSLRERGRPGTAPGEPAERTGMARAWHDAVDRFTGGVEAVVAGSGTVLFLVLLALVAWLIGRPIWRRLHPEDARSVGSST